MFEKTVEILRDALGDDDIEITMDSSLVDDLGLSSLEVISLVSSFEDEFDVEIPDRLIPKMRTVKDVVTYLEENAE